MSLTATTTPQVDGLIIQGEGRNEWIVTGAPWLLGVARSAGMRSKDGMGSGRVLSRAINGRYDIKVKRTARESAYERHVRELHEDEGSFETLLDGLREMKARRS